MAQSGGRARPPRPVYPTREASGSATLADTAHERGAIEDGVNCEASVKSDDSEPGSVPHGYLSWLLEHPLPSEKGSSNPCFR